MPKIAIGCPIRNRAWILPEYLEALQEIDYPSKVYLFLENDSEDESLYILQQIKPDMLQSIKTGADRWRRGEYNQDQFSHLAEVRNQFLEMFLQTDADYLLSVDSDVIVPPDILTRLLELADEKTIIGAAISNVAGKPLDGATPGNFLIRLNEYSGSYIHPPHYELSGVMDVDVVGAVYLIPRKAIKDGVRYGENSQGEDIYFSQQAKGKGYKLQVLLDPICDHRMTQ